MGNLPLGARPSLSGVVDGVTSAYPLLSSPAPALGRASMETEPRLFETAEQQGCGGLYTSQIDDCK
jgi:hypothetical protein